MKTNYEVRYAAHPEDAKSYDTARLRRDFLIERVFAADEVNMVYSMYDRMIVGGAMPVSEPLKLEAIDPVKAPYFLTRRELGIFNVGGAGVVKVGDKCFDLDYKEALYVGSGERDVVFESKDAANPAKFYFNSTTAHRNYPDKKVTKADAIVATMALCEAAAYYKTKNMTLWDAMIDMYEKYGYYPSLVSPKKSTYLLILDKIWADLPAEVQNQIETLLKNDLHFMKQQIETEV